jgi:hypothetical protein
MKPTIYNLKVETQSFLDKKITAVKKIVIDSYNCGNLLNKLTPRQEVLSFVETQIANKNKGIFYNYIVDKDGDIYCMVDPAVAAARCCAEDVYSEGACSLFPETCSPCDNRVTPHITRPDTELISVCTFSVAKEETGSIDTGIMTLLQKEAFEILIQYLIGKYNSEYNANLDSNSVILRNKFPGLPDIKHGHVLYRDDPTKFLIFKRNLNHQIWYPYTRYTELVTISDELATS